MVHFKTKINVVDNSGVLLVKCIKLLKGTKKNSATINSYIVVTVKRSLVRKKKKTIVKGDVFRCLIVLSSTNYNRNYFQYVKSDNNGVILIGENKLPLASRVFGPVFLELRNSKNLKLLSLFHSFI